MVIGAACFWLELEDLAEKWSIPKEHPWESPRVQGVQNHLFAFRKKPGALPMGVRKRKNPKVEGAAFSGTALVDLAEI